MKIFYTDIFELGLPAKHTFPIQKYRLLRKQLVDTGLISADQMEVAPAITMDDLDRVHERTYVADIQNGTLPAKAQRRLGFPWSPQLVERSRRSVGATLAACRAALSAKVAVNLGGGTHHAFPGSGEGYCVFNDCAVALRKLQAENRIQRALIIDCDVHQGNGTAAIFAGDASIFTFSIHGKNNFPFRKVKSDLDIALDDGTSDDVYFKALQNGLSCSLAHEGYDLACYLAGADPYHDDRFGRLALSKKGLAHRDRLVFETLYQAGVPVCVTMSGGYARNVQDTVDIHFQTIKIATEIFCESGDHQHQPT